MHSHAIIAFTAALVPWTTAAPTNDISDRGVSGLRVDLVNTNKQVFKSAPVELLKLYTKYGPRLGIKTPANVKNAAVAALKGTGVAIPEQYGSEYLVQVRLGQDLVNLDFDTGSANLWSASTFLPTSEALGHRLYNPLKTGTLNPGYTFNIGYEDGTTAGGVVYNDTVTVGGLTAYNVSVGAANTFTGDVASNTNSDGLLGLAFSTLNTVLPTHQKTFFDVIKPNLSQALFTVDLKPTTPGTYDFGFIDTTKYTGKLTYTQVIDISTGFWVVNATTYSIGSGAPPQDTIGPVIVDSGTSILYLPPTLVDAYWSQVKGSTQPDGYTWTFPCNQTLPDLHLLLAGTTITIPGTYLNFAPTGNTGLECYGGLQTYLLSGGNPILGDILFKASFIVFDQTKSVPRVGFAKKVLTS